MARLCTRWVIAAVIVAAVPASATADPSATPIAPNATPPPAIAPVTASVSAQAMRRTSSVAVDGHLDEPVWKTAPRQTGFTQRYPVDGGKPTFATSFAVLYDDEAIYVGVWCDDPEPTKIKALLTRRDIDAPADAVIIAFDSYHDRRTGYAFQLNAAGVQRDVILFDDSNQDDTWDAVWTGASAVTDHGWTAEYRIPLSQLRYPTRDVQLWGMQVSRTVGRTMEQDAWSPWPRSAPAIVSKFGTLNGIENLKPSRRLELLPYTTAGIEREPADPVNPQYVPHGGLGLDLKYGLGPAFTLSATINPDFGQVEADPSQITLGPFELFYPEKRPFFLEGTDLFRLPIGNDGNNETAFYSRRIGAAPDIDTSYDAYAKLPKATTIYGAAKITGKTRDGWSVGILDAVTGAQRTDIIDDDNHEDHPQVSALTNYAVARLKRDLRNGETQIGVSGTAVDRDLDDPDLERTLHDQAYTGGFQLTHRWDHDAWQLSMHGVESYVHGSTDAMLLTQLDANHYFERPDDTDEHLDPRRTSLTGTGMTVKFGRDGDTQNWRFDVFTDFRSPGLDLDDAGFQTGGDRILSFAWMQYREDKPSVALLNWQVNTDVFGLATFEDRVTDLGYEGNGSVTFENFWGMFGGFNIDEGYWDVISMRGGDALRADPNYNLYGGFNTDTRKRVWFNLNGNVNTTPRTGLVQGNLNIGATIQARSNVDLFIGPSWGEVDNPFQYVATPADSENNLHYLFSSVRQVTASMTTRLNWTFSPHASLQVYAQPFIASARYFDYKDVDNPGAHNFNDRFYAIQGNDYSIDYTNAIVYIHRPGMPTYAVAQPDFDLRQIRSTVVLRWEYRPGSNIYAIWSHGQSDSITDGRFELGRDVSAMLSAASDDIVMVKLNYWIGL